MKDCVFCKISNDTESEEYRIISSSGDCIVMLVSHPETPGHFIVFPKNHYSEVGEVKEIGKFWSEVTSLAEQLTKKLDAKAYTLKMNNRLYKLENNLLHVGHIHAHVIPRYAKTDPMNSAPIAANKVDLAKLRARLAG